MCLLFTARALSELKGNNLFTQHQWSLKAYGLTFSLHQILLGYILYQRTEKAFIGKPLMEVTHKPQLKC